MMGANCIEAPVGYFAPALVSDCYKCPTADVPGSDSCDSGNSTCSEPGMCSYQGDCGPVPTFYSPPGVSQCLRCESGMAMEVNITVRLADFHTNPETDEVWLNGTDVFKAIATGLMSRGDPVTSTYLMDGTAVLAIDRHRGIMISSNISVLTSSNPRLTDPFYISVAFASSTCDCRLMSTQIFKQAHRHRHTHHPHPHPHTTPHTN